MVLDLLADRVYLGLHIVQAFLERMENLVVGGQVRGLVSNLVDARAEVVEARWMQALV